MPRISTHVLDIAKGAPAAGIVIELHHGGRGISSSITNKDGRTEEPLITDDRLPAGAYELVFRVEDYLRKHYAAANPFFDDITIRFHVTDETANYHIPLLLAPHAYSTYRGS